LFPSHSLHIPPRLVSLLAPFSSSIVTHTIPLSRLKT
jgi:hypothetical protein